MKNLICFIPFLLGTPDLAQGVELSLTCGAMRSGAKGFATHAVDNGHGADYSSSTLPAVGVGVAWAAFTFDAFSLECTGSYLFPGRKEVTDRSSWSVLAGSGNATGTAHFRNSSAGLGARLSARLPIDWSLGLEYRWESYRLENGYENAFSTNNSAVLDTNQGRPWVHARIGYSFPVPVIQPFVAAVGAYALTQTRADGSFGSTLLKSMAPRTEVALQAGIRF